MAVLTGTPPCKGATRALKVGDRVRTTRDLEADVAEKLLPRGSIATVCELPPDNGGFHAIETEDCIYDVRLDEVELIVEEQKPVPSPTLSRTGTHSVEQDVHNRACVSWKATAPDQPSCVAHDFWTEGVRKFFGERQSGDGDSALAKFESSLQVPQPEDGPLVARRALFCAGLLMDAGRRDDAITKLRMATRADPELWPAHVELCLALADGGDTDAMMEAASTAIVEGGYWTSPWQRPAVYLPGLHSRSFWTVSEIPWVAELEKKHKVVQQELEHILAVREFDTTWAPVGGAHRSSGLRDSDALARGDWHEVVLFGAQESAGALGRRLAPKTAQLVRDLVPEAIDMAAAGAGEVILSALAPGTHVKPHCACSNHRLTAHLGLLVPADQSTGVTAAPSCGIRVGGVTKAWREGRVLLFDDSFEHEVWNDAGTTRVVLLIRFWHPDIVTSSQRRAALAHVSEGLALAHRLQLLPPVRPSFPEPSEELERRLGGEAGAGCCPGCGKEEGADLSLFEPPLTNSTAQGVASKRPSGRVVMVSRCCGHVSK